MALVSGVPNTVALKPEDSVPAEPVNWQWRECSPETVRGFSAVGYLFGRQIHLELDVPVGLVSTNWGGTVAEAWTSSEALAEFPGFENDLSIMRAAASDPDGFQAAMDAQWAAWWDALAQRDEGSGTGEWMNGSLDALSEEWRATTVPGVWEDEAGPFDGVVWFRRSFEVPAPWEGQELVRPARTHR